MGQKVGLAKKRIGEYLRNGELRPAEELLTSTRKSNISSRQMYHPFLSYCVKNGEQERLNEYKRWMKKDGFDFGILEYKLLIDCAKDKKTLKGFLQEMDKEKIERSTSVYNTIIDWYARKKLPKEAVQTFEEMKEKGFKPDRMSYVHLLLSIKDYASDEEILKYYFEAKKKQFDHIRLHQIGFASLIRMNRSNEVVDMAQKLASMGVTNPSKIYTSLLLALSRSDRLDEAKAILDELHKSQTKIEHETYFAMMNELGVVGRIQEMLELYYQAYERLGLNHVGTIKIIELLSKDKKQKELGQLVELLFNHRRISSFLCNSILAAFERLGDRVMFQETVKHMEVKGIAPTVATYTSMAKMYGSKDVDDLVSRYAEMKELGIFPDEYFFVYYLKAILESGRTKHLPQIRRDVNYYLGQGNVYYRFVGEWHIDRRRFSDFFRLFDEMQMDRCVLNVKMARKFLDMYYKNKSMPQEVQQFLERLKDHHPVDQMTSEEGKIFADIVSGLDKKTS